jgi:hypothetical protein
MFLVKDTHFIGNGWDGAANKTLKPAIVASFKGAMNKRK